MFCCVVAKLELIVVFCFCGVVSSESGEPKNQVYKNSNIQKGLASKKDLQTDKKDLRAKRTCEQKGVASTKNLQTKDLQIKDFQMKKLSQKNLKKHSQKKLKKFVKIG